ncbi:MAG: vancomycin resistance protein [Bacteroidetes bacterium]|nr:MAG: vancomycin resistance protein [Bacteroidota bacterium]
MPRTLLSQHHPLLYALSVSEKQFRRWIGWQVHRKSFVRERSAEKLPYRVKKHSSVLLRKLQGVEMEWQRNKVKNLALAIAKIDGILIRPGEKFSFCKLVGRPTKRKGYLPGMEISFGEARAGTGGGICQIANLVHWLVIHSPLTVTERHHHSYDVFPDEGRILPFGSGAAVFYNYLDYQFTNNTPWTFQLRLWLSDKCLEGELRVNVELHFSYHVFEMKHRFVQIGSEYFRQNEIWRKKIAKFQSGAVLETELVTKNFARMKYVPQSFVTLSSTAEAQQDYQTGPATS